MEWLDLKRNAAILDKTDKAIKSKLGSRKASLLPYESTAKKQKKERGMSLSEVDTDTNLLSLANLFDVDMDDKISNSHGKPFVS